MPRSHLTPWHHTMPMSHSAPRRDPSPDHPTRSSSPNDNSYVSAASTSNAVLVMTTKRSGYCRVAWLWVLTIATLPLFLFPFFVHHHSFVAPSSEMRTRTPQVPANKGAPPEQELWVISYSLYGKKKEPTDYTEGMINAARRATTIFPGWQIRIYHDNNIPDEVLDQLSTIGGSMMKLINVVTDLEPWVHQDLNPMAWRFLVASDEEVSAFIVRDGDSRPGMRDKAAVDEWLRSGRSFHIVRDHPMHNPTTFTPILGGMWGARGGALPQMERLLRTHYADGKQRRTDGRPGFKYAEDQNFLWQEIMPLAWNDCFQHDSYFCREANAVAFPVDRMDNDYVGNDFSLPDKIVVDPRLTMDGYGDKYKTGLDDRKLLEAKFGDNFAKMVNTTFAGPVKGSSTEVWAEFNRKKREAQGIITKPTTERGKLKLNFLKDKKKKVTIGI